MILHPSWEHLNKKKYHAVLVEKVYPEMTVSFTTLPLFVLDCTKSQSIKGWVGSERYDYLLSTLMFLLNRSFKPFLT